MDFPSSTEPAVAKRSRLRVSSVGMDGAVYVPMAGYRDLMHDDWRLEIELADDDAVAEVVKDLHSLRLEAAVRRRLGDRVALTHEGPRIHLYADRGEDAREAERVVRDLLAERGTEARGVTLCRWHPVELRWEDADVPLPRSEAALEDEREERDRAEAADARLQGWSEWEVRVELRSHAEVQELADRFEAEGVPVVRRWRFLLVGAATEDEARALAERLRGELPEGARVLAQGSGMLAWQVTHPNPFAYFDTLV